MKKNLILNLDFQLIGIFQIYGCMASKLLKVNTLNTFHYVL